MKFKPTSCKARSASLRTAAFTLVEVLAALLFMAIVIPAAVHGLRIAGLAGEVAQRKAVAGRIAERMLNELMVTGQASQAGQGGVVNEGATQYRWQLRNEAWAQDALRQLTMVVTFAAQGQDYDVQVATLFDSSQQTTAATTGTTAP